MSIDRLPRRGAPTRRELLGRAGSGLGSVALATMLAEEGLFTKSSAADEQGRSPLAPRRAHFVPRAKSVIFLFMYGGPSHLDLFDYKPALAQFAGKGVGCRSAPTATSSTGGVDCFTGKSLLQSSLCEPDVVVFFRAWDR